MNDLSEGLFKTLSHPSFLAMKGMANGVPIFIQTYAASLRTKCNLPYIATESDLDQWLAALRMAAQTELNKGNRISPWHFSQFLLNSMENIKKRV